MTTTDLSAELRKHSPQELLSAIRKRRVLNDFTLFNQTYFPDYFRLPPALCHQQFARDCETVLHGRGGHRYVTAAPRGVAKTTWHTVFLPLRCIVTASKKFIVIISDTEEQAVSQLRKIKMELEYNEQLRADFGDLKGPEWGSTQFITSNGVMVLALGSKQRLRGRGHGAYRPDLIIIDDYENDKNTQSSEQRQQLMELLDEAVAYAGDYYTDVIFIGTILHQESVLAQKLNNPLWDAKKFQSVLQWSARQDLWDEWEIIIQDRTNKERLADARRFYEAHEEEMLAGTLVVWPEKEDYYALMIELIRGGPAAFSKEKQNEPVNDEDCPFDVNRFGYYSDITEPYTCYGFVDPSMGDKETSDYSAILIVGVGQETGTRYVLEADIKRRKPDQIIADVLDYYQQYSFSAFEAENNGFQKFWLSKLVSALHAKGYWPLPEGVNHTGNKVARIKSLQPSLNDQSIRFKRTGQELLIEQLRYFPLASHDDGPDALEAVDELTKNNTQFIFGVL